MKKKNSILKKVILSRALFIASLLILLVVSSALSKEVSRRSGIEDEIQGLQAEIAQVETKNQEMRELLSYLKTSEFLEGEARVKLGLAKEGEEAIVFDEIPNAAPDLRVMPETKQDKVSHGSWMEYFFGPKK